IGPSIIDMGSGLWSVIGILSALEMRRRTGVGCTVDTSLYETALSWMTVPVAMALSSGRDPGRTGSEAAMIVPYKAYRASDRYVVVAAGNDNLFRRFCEVVGRASWAGDPRFATNAARVENRDALNELIDEIVAQQSAAHWVAQLDA